MRKNEKKSRYAICHSKYLTLIPRARVLYSNYSTVASSATQYNTIQRM